MEFTGIVAGWARATIEFLPQLILIAVILALTSVVSRRLQGLVQHFSGRTQAPPEIGVLLGRIARVGILLIGVLLVLQQLGWTSTVLGFVTGLGIVGVVAGFALQDIVKQFAAGVLLLMLRPFRVGDVVQVGAFEGAVQEIQLRATVLKTDEGDEVLIPNADIYSGTVTNRSRYGLRRRTLPISVPHSADLARLREALVRAAASVPGVAAVPAPQVIGTALNDANVTLELHFWVEARAKLSGDVATEVLDRVRQELGDSEETRDRRHETEDTRQE